MTATIAGVVATVVARCWPDCHSGHHPRGRRLRTSCHCGCVPSGAGSFWFRPWPASSSKRLPSLPGLGLAWVRAGPDFPGLGSGSPFGWAAGYGSRQGLLWRSFCMFFCPSLQWSRCPLSGQWLLLSRMLTQPTVPVVSPRCSSGANMGWSLGSTGFPPPLEGGRALPYLWG